MWGSGASVNFIIRNHIVSNELQPNAPKRWEQVKLVFQAALAFPPEQRRAFITRACADDPLIHDEVSLLLTVQEESGGGAADLVTRLKDTSTLFPGQPFLNRELGPYRISSLLGRGGMGEVWQAEDTRLGRRVALKLLPKEFSGNAERLQRFQREARAISSLNHPNIVTIYEVGQAEGIHYLAMEFVEGQTLRQQQANTKTPPIAVLALVMQITEALIAAHADGIVHRDIKPENVMVRRDGLVKLLDFGLARRMRPPIGEPAFDSTITSPGLVMGTLAFMSPEQVRGEELDERTDLFSLGVLLYEMLAGQPPFAGETSADLMAAILTKEPPPLTNQRPVLQTILNKALCKDRAQRYQTADELQTDLKHAQQEIERHSRQADPSKTNAHAVTPTAPLGTPSSTQIIFTELKRHKRGVSLSLALTLLVLAALGFGLYRWISQTAARRAVAPFQMMNLNRVTTSGNVVEEQAIISPDGKYLAYVVDEAQQQSLWVRQITTNATVQITSPAEVSFQGLTISHDSNYIYYLTVDRVGVTAIHRVASIGGATRKLVTDASGGLTLSPNDQQLAFVRNDPQTGESALIITTSEGAAPRQLATRKYPDQFFSPAWSPQGDLIACASLRNSSRGRYFEITGITVANGQEKLLSDKQWFYAGQMAWLPDQSGLLINAADQSTRPSQIWLALLTEGTPRKITNDLNNYSGLSLTANAQTLVTVQTEKTSALWVSPAAQEEQAKQLQLRGGKYEGVMGLAWTPDNRLLYASTAIGNTALNSGDPDLWLVQPADNNPVQLTFNVQGNIRPIVTADGRYIIWVSNRLGTGNLWRMNIDGSQPQRITQGIDDVAPDCSPDGRWVIYQGVKDTRSVLMKVSIEGGEVTQLTQETAARPAISPDGQWIACYYFDQQAQPKRWRLAILPFTGGPPARLLDLSATADRLITPRWTADGQAITYVDKQRSASNLWRQPTAGGAPSQLTNFKTGMLFNFAWSRDGKQLACARGTITHDVVTISNFR